jgi:nucleotide-binding universal stress UspA family protein
MAYVTIGIDGSRSAGAALEWGLAEARRRSLAVQLVSVWSTPLTVAGPTPALAIPAMVRAARAAAHQTVDDAAKLAADAGVEATTEVLEGDPAHILLALSAGADQLVVGAHGHSALVRGVLGSVSAAAVHHATGPVTVVRTKPSQPQHRVVVGIDGSDDSVAALRRAALEAASARAELAVVTAWHRTSTDLLDEFTGIRIPGADELRELAEARARKVMHQAETDSFAIPVRLSVRYGTAEHVLSRSSAHADLLVLGTHGWGAIDRMLFGSTSNALLHRAACPVQVVPIPA